MWGQGAERGTLGGTERNGGSLTKNDKRPGIRDRMSGFLGRFLGGGYLHFFRFTAEMAEVCTLVRGLQKESV